MKLYSQFYRDHGVRKLSNLSSPTIQALNTMELPKASVFHHMPYDDTDIGPTPNDPVVSCYPHRMMIKHHHELIDPTPVPRKNTNATPAKLEMNYRSRFKKIRPTPDVTKSMRDLNTLILHNYAAFIQSYIYQVNEYSNWFKWNNAFNSFIKTMKTEIVGNDRQHFFTLNLPEVIPSVKLMRVMQKPIKSVPKKIAKIFARPEMIILNQLWGYMGVDRANSAFSIFTAEELSRLNMIVTAPTGWTVLNFGTLLEILKEIEEVKTKVTDDKGKEKTVRTDSVSEEGARRPQMLLYMFLHNVALAGAVPAVAEDGKTEKEGKVVKPTAKPVNKPDPDDKVDTGDDDLIEDPDVEEDPIDTSEPETETIEIDVLKNKDKLNKDLEDFEELFNLADDDIDDDALDDEADAYAKKVIEKNQEVTVDAPSYKAKEPVDVLRDKLKKQAEEGRITAGEFKRFEKLIEQNQNLMHPSGVKLEEFRQIKPEDIAIKDEDRLIPKKPGVIDDSLAKSTIHLMDAKYINEVMAKDIVNSVMSLQKADFIVTNYTTETVETAMDRFEVTKVRIVPTDGGDPSTLTFRYPLVNPDGTYMANGVKYRMRKQRVDLPIRKVSPDSVALTTDYAKVFVNRSEMRVVNYGVWVGNKIRLMSLEANDYLESVIFGNFFYHELKTPRIYSILSKEFAEIKLKSGIRLFLDYKERTRRLDEDALKRLEKDGSVYCGDKGKGKVVVSQDNVFYLITENKETEVLGTIEDLLGLDPTTAPTDIAEFRLFAKQVPLGIVLGYWFGLSRLMSILDVTPRRVPAGTRMELLPHEYAIRFNDETLVFSRYDAKAQLVLAGLNRYHRDIKRYSVDDFNNREVFINVMEANGVRIGFVRELNLAMDLFVDPISLGILKDMGEPETLEGLLLRSCELLLTDWHPKETDMEYMRIRGYERFSAAVYSSMTKAIRMYRSRGAAGENKIEMNPEAVWMAIGLDTSTGQIDELNPIENLREAELSTYMGTGGRSNQSMVKRTRVFLDSDIGITSEGSTDSSTVGINNLLSPNANFKNLRGVGVKMKAKDVENSSLVSTAALISPAIHMDDPKRANFAGIQHKHTVATEGATTTPLRTGYERVVAHRVNDLFAVTADKDGKVVELTDKVIKIQYKDGTVKTAEIGRRFGVVPGTTVPHTIITDLKVGDRVSEGDIVAYNKGFFKPDPLDKTQVTYTNGVLTKVALLESQATFEDACEISPRLAEKFATDITEVRRITLSFTDRVSNLVKVGDRVESETILCTIEEGVLADNGLFDDESIEILKTLSADAPKAKYDGIVEKIEVFYHGDKEDMSESVLKLVEASDRERMRVLKAMGKTPTTGAVDSSVRIGKEPLDLDSLVVNVYITHRMPAIIGDKGVFANQMKTIISSVMSGVNKTEISGEDIDAKFPYKSLANRIVLSPEVIGTTNTLLIKMGKMAADTYFKNK